MGVRFHDSLHVTHRKLRIVELAVSELLLDDGAHDRPDARLGRLLQRAVDDSGLVRDQLYVTNAVKHFRFVARGKRRIHATPEMAHIVACRPWLVAELREVDPRIVVVLGATAAKSLLGAQFKVTRHRGEVITIDTTHGPRQFVPTVHPSSVLRVPEPDRPAAYDGLVAGLRVVARAVRDGA